MVVASEDEKKKKQEMLCDVENSLRTKVLLFCSRLTPRTIENWKNAFDQSTSFLLELRVVYVLTSASFETPVQLQSSVMADRPKLYPKVG